MVIVMYGGGLVVLFVAVVLAATKDARLVKESLAEIKAVKSRPILSTSERPHSNRERVYNNV